MPSCSLSVNVKLSPKIIYDTVTPLLHFTSPIIHWVPSKNLLTNLVLRNMQNHPPLPPLLQTDSFITLIKSARIFPRPFLLPIRPSRVSLVAQPVLYSEWSLSHWTEVGHRIIWPSVRATRKTRQIQVGSLALIVERLRAVWAYRLCLLILQKKKQSNGKVQRGAHTLWTWQPHEGGRLVGWFSLRRSNLLKVCGIFARENWDF